MGGIMPDASAGLKGLAPRRPSRTAWLLVRTAWRIIDTTDPNR